MSELSSTRKLSCQVKATTISWRLYFRELRASGWKVVKHVRIIILRWGGQGSGCKTCQNYHPKVRWSREWLKGCKTCQKYHSPGNCHTKSRLLSLSRLALLSMTCFFYIYIFSIYQQAHILVCFYKFVFTMLLHAEKVSKLSRDGVDITSGWKVVNHRKLSMSKVVKHVRIIIFWVLRNAINQSLPSNKCKAYSSFK